MTNPTGLQALNLTIDQAIALPRGKRRGVASYLTRHGFYEEARGLLTAMVSEDPAGQLYRSWLVYALIGCGEIAKAQALSETLLADFPASRMVMVARAEALFASGDTNAAFDVFKLYMEDPEKSYGYWGRAGAAAQRLGQWTDADQALKRAHEIYAAREEDSEDQIIPIYLWKALAAQAEHEGVEENPFKIELETLRIAEMEKVLEALTKPSNYTDRRKPRVPEITTERKIDPEVAATTAASLAEPEPNLDLDGHLKKLFGYDKFRPGQQRVIESIIEGVSVLAVMPTGAGKSLCYQLPSMLLDGITLVVSPLIALMKDQVDGLPAHVQEQVTLINSTLEGDEIDRRLRDIRNGRYKLVYAAPERLRQRPFLHALRSRGVSLLVVDEAHCVSMWGHDFRPDYLFIGDALSYLGDPTVLGMTATATPQMRIEISNHFRRQMSIISTGTHRQNLFLECNIVRSDEEKMRELIKICQEIDGAGIVYTRSRKKAEDLARLLKRERVSAAFYHAGMDAESRARTHEEFMDGRWRIICATVAFGMGIDKPDVRFVAHYSLPSSVEDYYQEAGRAGRDGLPSRCILLCTSSDKANMTRWLNSERINIELPKRCYQLIRDLTKNSPFAAIHTDDFEREFGSDETKIRSAISLLEKADMIKRHLDIPVTVTLTLTSKGASEGGADFQSFIQNARLKVGQRMSLETTALAGRVSMAPGDVDEKLLDWQSAGYMTYWGSGRMMLIERLPAPKESKRLLEDMLAKYARVQEMRVELTMRYAETSRCRHDVIAAHFGENPITGCASCENCVPREQRSEAISSQAKPIYADLTDSEKKRKIVETVRMIPGRVGFTGLVRVLKGSVQSYIKRDTCQNFGIFANLPKAAIERCVNDLIEEKRIARDDGEYRLLWPAGAVMEKD
ncbi:MAG: RecQ family ATP-dependent DNA helicase [Armatimonadetes bacterium]|nr:RecQ family ATP-dependent DNA helicase [Armatimonadota bacterium]